MTNGRHCCGIDRRQLLITGLTAGAAAGLAGLAPGSARAAAEDRYAPPAEGALPATDVELDHDRAALLVIDPLVDFLDPEGVAWDVVKDNVEELGTIDNLERLFEAAHAAELPVVVSPHYYYPHDHEWDFGGPLERMMHDMGMFRLQERFADIEGTGADFLERFKPYIENGRAIVTSPHKVYGPENNDVVLQLRKRGISQVILAGMSANLCVESHLRSLLEQGFEVAVVRDATAAAQLPEGDGYLAALINFRFIANALWSTDEAVERLDRRT